MHIPPNFCSRLHRAAHALVVLAILWAACGGPTSARTALAQGIGINGTGAAADTSAILDLASTSKGFLPPRLSTIQRNAIVLPATGLVVYQTDGVQGLYWNAGTPGAPNWKQVADAAGVGGQWSTSGPDLFYTEGQVGVGTNTFEAGLTVWDPQNGLRVATTNAGGAVASFGGVGEFRVDAPFVVGGRLRLLESGFLGLGRTTPVSRLDVAGGAGDLAGTEGDFRIGDALTRLKMGVSTSGTVGAATIMEQGPAGQYNVLALGSQGNKVLYVNGNTQRVGIGTDAPNAPLGFPAVLGKKITLYPGAGGDVGIGVAGNRLQLYGDYPNADVAIGQDQGGTFVERFAVKPTGALAVNGNTGSAGQVLQSNGSGAATWGSGTNTLYNNTYYAVSSTFVDAPAGGSAVDLPGMLVTFTAAGPFKIVINFDVVVIGLTCTSCRQSGIIEVRMDGGSVHSATQDVTQGEWNTVSGCAYYSSPFSGTHTVKLVGYTTDLSHSIRFGSGSPVSGSKLIVQVIPQ